MGGTLRLFADFKLNSIKFNNKSGASLDRNGHKVTGGEELTLTGSDTNMTIMDSSEGKKGSFANVNVLAGKGLTVDGVEVGQIIAADKTLKITLRIKIADKNVLH